MSVIYKENILTADDYILFQRKMGWSESKREQVEKSLSHTLFSVAALQNDEIIGMGRLLGDSASYWYMNDVFVLTQYQKKGIGRDIVKRLIQYVKRNSISGTSASIYLFCAEDKGGFYEKIGFTDCQKAGGMGMFIDIDIE